VNESFPLGRIAGVRVGANWSVVVIFLLIAVGVAGGRLPIDYPDRSGATYAFAGVVTAFLFFLSLLAHEVAHAVVARRNGLPVEGITLWLFGGVSKLGGEPKSPGADFRIAGVGPLVSVALGIGFGLLGGLLLSLGIDNLVVGVLGYLAFINLVLAVFNLVPAAPLDGGRLLRAALWKWRGDRVGAAVGAARAGRLFGFLLIGFGFAQLLTTPGLGGLWLVLIGFFIVSAAAAEQQQAQVSGALEGVTVGEVMTRDPLTAPADLPVSRFLDDYVLTHRFSSYPLLAGDGRPVGLVTINRLRGLSPEKRPWTSVADIACPVGELPVASADEPVIELLERMRGCADGRALVVEEGRVVGIVSPTDIARLLQLGDLRGGPASRV
jgi:Zn-dependent protease/CBS domain-containing protein